MEVVEFDEGWNQLGCRAVHMDDGLINCHDFAISASSYVFFQVGLAPEPSSCTVLIDTGSAHLRNVSSVSKANPSSRCLSGSSWKILRVCQEEVKSLWRTAELNPL